MTSKPRRPRLDFMEESISGPVVTPEGKKIAAKINSIGSKIKQKIKRLFK